MAQGVSMDTIKFYLTASSKKSGALGIHHVYATEAVLGACLDARTGPRGMSAASNALELNELRYGWLRDGCGAAVDEVMLARPVSGMRVLMTHGGAAVREAVIRFLEDEGFCSYEDLPEGGSDPADLDTIYDMVLSSCVTEAQAAAVLEARGRGDSVPADLLATRRVLLAGPPNAGKSSLMNRLVGYDRAFVHAEAGATRDVVDELVDVGGHAVLVGDLPGFSGEEAGVGREAWRLAASRLAAADCILFVVDGACAWRDGAAAAAGEIIARLAALEQDAPPIIVVVNKSDLPAAIAGEPWREHFPAAEVVRVSCLVDEDVGEAVAGVIAPILAKKSSPRS